MKFKRIFGYLLLCTIAMFALSSCGDDDEEPIEVKKYLTTADFKDEDLCVSSADDKYYFYTDTLTHHLYKVAKADSAVIWTTKLKEDNDTLHIPYIFTQNYDDEDFTYKKTYEHWVAHHKNFVVSSLDPYIIIYDYFTHTAIGYRRTTVSTYPWFIRIYSMETGDLVCGFEPTYIEREYYDPQLSTYFKFVAERPAIVRMYNNNIMIITCPLISERYQEFAVFDKFGKRVKTGYISFPTEKGGESYFSYGELISESMMSIEGEKYKVDIY